MRAIERKIVPASPSVGALDWLHLAAAPTFAVMAVLTAVLGGGMVGMLCSGMLDASPITGMVPMYVLMSVFHSAPWLRLIRARAITPPRCARPSVG